MKFFVFIIALTFFNLCLSQTEATIDLKKFNSSNSPFLETYINIFSGSVAYIPNENGIDRCKIEVLQLLKQGDNIIDFQKIILTNDDSTNEDFHNDLLHQHRFLVENGTYSYEVEIVDLFKDTATKTIYTKTFEVDFKKNELVISDIELLDSFWKSTSESTTSKSGYEMIPLATDYFSPQFDKIAYYFEIYNSDKAFDEDSSYVLQHFIESFETGVIAGNLNKISKEKAYPINPTLYVFEISSLSTGNYNLVVQIKNKKNELVKEKKLRFQRLNLSNEATDENFKDVSLTGKFTERLPLDSLDEFIHCLRPISSPSEMQIVDNQLEKMTDSLKLQYIYNFWYSRNNKEPEKDWNAYKFQVNEVNVMFGTRVKEGYETDRGRIFLKYGAPNSVADQKQEANSYPYQIWHYYKIGKFNNKRFVFYDRDLVTNDYQLLHSDLIGEIQNYHWKIDLKRRSTRGGDVDDTDPDSEYGERTNDLFYKP